MIAWLLACGGTAPGTDGDTPTGRVPEGALLGSQVRAEADGVWVSAPGVEGDGVVARLDRLSGDATLADASVVMRASEPGQVGGPFAVCDWDSGQAVAVGAPELGDRGRAWLVADPGPGETAIGAQPYAENRQDGAHTGSSVTCAPDLLLVGAPDTAAAAAGSGTVDVYVPGESGPDKIANVDTAFGGAHLGLRTGVLPGVDWDGDGTEDLVVGAPGSARAHVLPGPIQGSVLASAAGYVLQGEDGGELGYALATGDLDGDGALDLVLGEPGAGNGKGRLWVVRGPIDADHEGLLRNLAVSVGGVTQGAKLGFSLAVVGDVDVDGRDD
ncbi:MAG: VCBS repeat-containing protein, partial [Myxococcales bacterium]|nr:VCBS repeat-containing protein [Myxococcales bacterium]